MGVDCFKTDFGERIPTDVVYHDGSDPESMHNYYTFLYNKARLRDFGAQAGPAARQLVFARSATAGGQQFPVHWGGDCDADYESMAESLRGGLSLGLCRLRLLEPRHRRLREHGAGACLQTLVRLRPAVHPQPAAWQHLLSRAMGL